MAVERTRTGQVLRSTLGRSLLLWFLVVSIVPLALFAFISYYRSQAALTESVSASLLESARLRQSEIMTFFSAVMDDLDLQARSEVNAEILQSFIEAFETSGKELATFTTSYAWVKIAQRRCGDLRILAEVKGYYDIFLVDYRGNVLFSVEEEADLGMNLFTGKYSDSLLSATCRRTMDTGQKSFSDLTRHAPSDNAVASFVSDIVLDEDGDTIGVLVFQLNNDKLNEITGHKSVVYETYNTFLVGSDLLLRTPSAMSAAAGAGDMVLKAKVDTDQTKLWLEKHVPSTVEPGAQCPVITYAGNHGRPVIGVHRHFAIAGVPLAVIAEITTGEAFAELNMMKITTLASLAVLVLVVLAVSFYLTRNTVLPVVAIAQWTRDVARGNLSQRTISAPTNEIGGMYDDFASMTTALAEARNRSQRQNWIAAGRESLSELLRGNPTIEELCSRVMTYTARYLDCPVGALYVADGQEGFNFASGYSFTPSANQPDRFEPGEGIIGQAALTKKHLFIADVPEGYLPVESYSGQASPTNILAFPFVYNDETVAVMELGSFHEFAGQQVSFLSEVTEGLSVSVLAAQKRAELRQALETSGEQAQTLEAQQEELRAANEELEEQTQLMQEKVAELERTRDALRKNEQKTARQKAVLETINRVIQKSLTCETKEELGLVCLNVAEEITGSKSGFIGEINPDGLFDTLAISNPGMEACRVPEGQATLVVQNMALRGVDRATMAEGRSRIVNGVASMVSHPDHVPLPEGHPAVAAFLGVPFIYEGKVAGMIGLANKPGGYTPADQEDIESLSIAFVEALQRKKLDQEIKKQRDEALAALAKLEGKRKDKPVKNTGAKKAAMKKRKKRSSS